MIEYFDVFKFISKKADLYNYINPFFNKNYWESHNFFYVLIALKKYKYYFDNLYIAIDYNIRLDVNQRIAILINPVSELIIAGAGSGKTTTIAAKIKYMVDILKINSEDILLLSYTNEAVKEMQKIIVDKFEIKVEIITFHKFALLLLKAHGRIIDKIPYNGIIENYNWGEKAILNIYLYIFYNIKIKDLREKNQQFINAFNEFQDETNKYYFEGFKLKNGLKSLFFKQVSKKYNNCQKLFDTFDSIIYKASELIQYNNHFKYILIDEYQDISNLRLKLISNYIKIENSKLMCVGDDFQTIFSFAASNISNITNFEKCFTNPRIIKIINTYRNSQELIDIAGQFVMKNSQQIKKKLRSKKHASNPIEIVNYKNKHDLINKMENLIEPIINSKIAILGRYKNDINRIIDNNIFTINEDKLIFKNVKELNFFTVHTSKGLGFDHVFLINNQKGYYGFPPIRRNREIFIKEKFLFEERRLFYVALTRTKNKVYLMYPNKKYSKFLKEIKKMLKKK